MNTSAVDKVVADAAALPPAEFSTLLLKLQALQFVSAPKATTSSELPEDLHALTLYHALSLQLRVQLQIPPIPVDKFFLSSRSANQVKESLALAVEQLNTLAPGMTRTEWASVSDLVAGLAVTQVRRGRFAVPWFGISLVLKNLPALLDEHFPGYASSNLLKLVLRLRTQQRSAPDVRNKSDKKAGAR
jgi:hypothetical protein